jgi:HEPN domain-containing protein
MEQLRTVTAAQWPSICFHAHEAVEKLLKSVILSTHTPPPRIHALWDLQSRGPEAVRSDAVLRAHCAVLDAVFPRSRYPDEGPLGQADADAAIAAARAARSILRRALP